MTKDRGKAGVDIRIHYSNGGKIGSPIPQKNNKVGCHSGQEVFLVLDNGGENVLVDIHFNPPGTGHDAQGMTLPPTGDNDPWSSAPTKVRGKNGSTSVTVTVSRPQRRFGFFRTIKPLTRTTIHFMDPLKMIVG